MLAGTLKCSYGISYSKRKIMHWSVVVSEKEKEECGVFYPSIIR